MSPFRISSTQFEECPNEIHSSPMEFHSRTTRKTSKVFQHFSDFFLNEKKKIFFVFFAQWTKEIIETTTFIANHSMWKLNNLSFRRDLSRKFTFKDPLSIKTRLSSFSSIGSTRRISLLSRRISFLRWKLFQSMSNLIRWFVHWFNSSQWPRCDGKMKRNLIRSIDFLCWSAKNLFHYLSSKKNFVEWHLTIKKK